MAGLPAGRGCEETVRDRIVAAHTAGHGWTAVARQLNDAQVPTARGGPVWYPSTVRAIIKSHTTPDGYIEPSRHFPDFADPVSALA